MRFKGLDLNLIVALDILLDEQNVSRAAARLCVSQPAMSAALGRLRDYFQDPLLVVHGKTMIPTPHAKSLIPLIRNLLADASAIISTSAQFDPMTSHRRFRICASDYLASVLFSKVMPQLRREAPMIRLDFAPNSDQQLSQLDQGEIDVLISVEEFISPDHPAELLFQERHIVAGWAENPLFARPISQEDFYSSGHIVVEIGRQRPTSFAERELRAMRRDRRIEMVTSSFLSAPEMLVGTELLLVMGQRLAQVYAERIAVTYSELPFDFPVMSIMIQFHKTQASDPALRWLIDSIKQVAARS